MNKEKEDKSICRALITASVDESYDFECIAVPSDNKQLKYSWDNNEYFYQVLRTNKENIDSSRLDSGLPLFDNHPEMEDAGALNQLGITLTYDFLTEGLAVRCKFGARADQALKDDVKNQIVKTVSIEGCVQNYTIERKVGEIPVYYADLWTPESLSFAPVPQDISAQIEVKRAIQKQIEIKQEYSFYKSLTNKF